MANQLEVLLIVNLFWATASTIFAYAFVNPTYSNVLGDLISPTMSVEEMGQQVQGTLSAQTSIPVIDVGALIFYSGVILVDFVTNFLTAIPSMGTALITIFQYVFGIDAVVAYWIKMFVYVFVMIVWMIYLLQIVLAMRGGARVV